MKLGLCSSSYSDYSMGWTVLSSNPGSVKRFFSSPKHPDQLWSPSILLFDD